MEKTEHSYTLKPGLFSFANKLTITPEYIEFKNANARNAITRIDKASFKDVKYFGNWIVWYKFTIGYSYKIEIKYGDDRVLPIRFVAYIDSDQTGATYTDISKWIGKYFLSAIVNARLDELHTSGRLELNDLTITNGMVEFNNHQFPWQEAGLKEYHQYFEVFNKKDPNIHKRISFDEWNSEVLFNVLKTLTAEGGA